METYGGVCGSLMSVFVKPRGLTGLVFLPGESATSVYEAIASVGKISRRV
jgi:hypothetical protein